MRDHLLERTLIDQVEQIHLSLIEDDQYFRYLEAVYDEQAVEGSLFADDTMAAEMIRDYAKKIACSAVAHEKAATIVKALGAVLRRYGASRKQRRQTGAAKAA